MTQENPTKRYTVGLMNFGVILLSLILIVWISVDTFEAENLLLDHRYMQFQFWVCIFFVLDFFVGLFWADNKMHFFKHHLVFLLLSIPYINIINILHLELSHDAIYFVRFIPLARGALAMSIVLGYLSSNPVSSLLLSYLSIIVMVTYFCSLIFFQRECGVNPEVKTYWTALWWSAMNMTTVGCNISPVTAAGKIIAVILPMCGMIIFPLFTVYLTDYVTRLVKRGRKERTSDNAPQV